MNRTLVERREATATRENAISANSWVVAPGVWRVKDLFVNIHIIQNTEGTGWVLVDTGLRTTAAKIRSLVNELFGSAGSRPHAIILTHGHFDHSGSLLELAEDWGVPVYCHHMERPFLTGIASYPPPDPSVGGGVMALMSFAYPRKPVNIEQYLRELPIDGSVPGLEQWQWIHTPGHTPGHISLFREKDGVLLAGDAFVTTMQESLLAVATQKKYICGPPKYFTPDWGAAARSVRRLASLEPSVITTGHGHAMYGDEARRELHKLGRDFWKRGMPATGRYVKSAAEFDENGIPVHIPPARGTMLMRIAVAAVLITAAILVKKYQKRQTGITSRLSGMLSKKIMAGSWAALGATAPASPAMPSLPLIPAV